MTESVVGKAEVGLFLQPGAGHSLQKGLPFGFAGSLLQTGPAELLLNEFVVPRDDILQPGTVAVPVMKVGEKDEGFPVPWELPAFLAKQLFGPPNFSELGEGESHLGAEPSLAGIFIKDMAIILDRHGVIHEIHQLVGGLPGAERFARRLGLLR